jgi:hypothetical protein
MCAPHVRQSQSHGCPKWAAILDAHWAHMLPTLISEWVILYFLIVSIMNIKITFTYQVVCAMVITTVHADNNPA